MDDQQNEVQNKMLDYNNDTELKFNKPLRKSLTWMEIFMKFTQITSLHAVNKLFDEYPFIIRRLFWLLIVLAAMFLVVYQTMQSIFIFLSYPSTFSVRLNYETSLRFPAVTICNHNNFKISTASQSGLYRYLDSLSRTGQVHFHVQSKFLSKMNLTHVLNQNRHELRDFIKKCYWNSDVCNYNQFQMLSSHQEVCYTFNSDDALSTNLTGTLSGLNILLNIEQYEYMRSKSQAAGVKIYIHDQGFLPTRAISIPPGMKAFISLQSTELRLLEKPYGECGDRPLFLHKRYTAQACLDECRVNLLSNICQCSLATASINTNNFPLCSMLKYMTCIVPTIDKISVSMDKCNCTVDCNTIDYNTKLSFSKISTFDTEEITSLLKENVSQQVINAREVFYRKNEDKQKQIERILIQYNDTIQRINFLVTSIQSKLSTFQNVMKKLEEGVEIRRQFHDFVLERLVYNMRNNFVRGYEVKYERSLNQFTSDYSRLMHGLEYAFKELRKPENEFKKCLYSHYDSRLIEYQTITKVAKQDFISIRDRLSVSELISIYRVFPDRLYDFILVDDSLVKSNFKKSNYTGIELEKWMDKYYNLLQDFRIILKDQYEGNSNLSDKTFNSKGGEFTDIVRKLHYRFYIYKNDTVITAQKKAETLREVFQTSTSTYKRETSSLEYNCNNVQELFSSFHQNMNLTTNKALSLALDYLNEKTNFSQMTNILHNKNISSLFAQLYQQLDQMSVESFAMEVAIERHQQTLQNYLNLFFINETSKFYSQMCNDIDCICVDNEDKCWRENFTDILKGQILKVFKYMSVKSFKTSYNLSCLTYRKYFNCDFRKYDNASNSMNTFYQNQLSSSEEFVKEIAKLTSLKFEFLDINSQLLKITEEFQEETMLSKTFISNNLIQIQIYYDELSFTTQTQVPSYVFTQLLSDLGGNIGLFMGASIVSLVELFDFFIVESIQKLMH